FPEVLGHRRPANRRSGDLDRPAGIARRKANAVLGGAAVLSPAAHTFIARGCYASCGGYRTALQELAQEHPNMRTIFYFRAKTALLGLAGCNMTAFHRIGTREIARWDAAGGTPVAAKSLGRVSLLVWIAVWGAGPLRVWMAVVLCGRWIGFTLH